MKNLPACANSRRNELTNGGLLQRTPMQSGNCTQHEIGNGDGEQGMRTRMGMVTRAGGAWASTTILAISFPVIPPRSFLRLFAPLRLGIESSRRTQVEGRGPVDAPAVARIDARRTNWTWTAQTMAPVLRQIGSQRQNGSRVAHLRCRPAKRAHTCMRGPTPRTHTGRSDYQRDRGQTRARRKSARVRDKRA